MVADNYVKSTYVFAPGGYTTFGRNKGDLKAGVSNEACQCVCSIDWAQSQFIKNGANSLNYSCIHHFIMKLTYYSVISFTSCIFGPAIAETLIC